MPFLSRPLRDGLVIDLGSEQYEEYPEFNGISVAAMVSKFKRHSAHAMALDSTILGHP